VTTFEKKLTKQNNLQEKIKREAITFKLMDTTSTPTFSFAFFNQYTDVPLKVEDSFKIYQEKGKNRIYFEFEDLYKVDGNEYKTLTYKKKKFNERFDFLYY
jgi:non-homologous end joining protein Ku